MSTRRVEMEAGAREWIARLGLPALVALLGICAFWAAPPAHADTAFCPPGEAAGECSSAQGLAIEPASEELYLVDRGNRRIDVFDAGSKEFLFAFGWGVDTGASELEKCTTASGCRKGLDGAGAGQLASDARSIALDGEAERVYLFNGGNLRVDVYDLGGEFLFAFGWGVDTGAGAFEKCTTASGCQKGKGGGSEEGRFNSLVDMVAVGPGNVVHVSDMPSFENDPRVERFDEEGEFIDEVELEHEDRLNGGLAVDSEGDIYAKFNKGGGVFKFEADGSAYGAPYPLDPELGSAGLAIGGADELFAAQREKGANLTASFSVVAHYSAEGAILRRFGYGSLEGITSFGVAHYPPSAGDVFANDSGPFGARYLEELLPPGGPIAPETSLKVSTVGSVWAGIEAEVNPEGKATEYRIDYVDRESFDTEGGFESPNTEATGELTLEEEGGPAEDFRLHAANLQVGCNPFSEKALKEGKCLEPSTEYLFRVVAEHEGGAKDEAEGTFETRPPLEVEALYAVAAGTGTATLKARVNPLGSEAGGHFEYVELSQYEETGFEGATQVPDVEGGEAPLDFGAGEEGATRGTVARGLAEGTSYRYRLVVEDPFGSFDDQERTLTTLATGAAEPCPANAAYRVGASAALPDCRAYELVSPLDKEGGDIKVLGDGLTGLPAVLEQSSLSGGKLAYGSYRSFAGAPSAPFTSQYVARRDAGAGAWLTHPISPAQGNLLGGLGDRYDTGFKLFTPDLCEGWIRSFAEPPLTADAVPGYFNLYRRLDPECGDLGYEALTTVAPPSEPVTLNLELQGAAADGSKAVFLADDALAEGGSALTRQLYGSENGEMRFMCVLPGGGDHGGPCTAGRTTGAGPQAERRANVENALSADASRLYWTAADGVGRIYLRLNPFGEGAECAGEAAPCTVEVSKAGEELSGTSGSTFQAAAKDGSAALYTTAKLEAGVSDLYRFSAAGAVSELIAGGVAGVVGASEDLTRIYFVSSEAIEGSEGASEGEPNLYLFEEGGEAEYRFIATLDPADANVTPGVGGSSAVAIEPLFRSTRVTPDGAHAAFMSVASLTGYDNAEASSGEPAAEVYLYDAGADGGKGALRCASCNPSGARPVGVNVDDEATPFWVAAELRVWTNSLYLSRALSADGKRLFFESTDALVARDTNSRRDVYQWAAEGTGGCDAADASFAPGSGGCVELISSGQGELDSRFVDASPDGRDVFFATLAGLVPQDYGLADIYDARVGGGLPSPPVPAAGCEGEGCQSPPPAPEAQTPSSLTYRGPGNLAAPTSPFARCNKAGRRAQRLSRRAKALRRSARRVARGHNRRAASRARALRRKATRHARAAHKHSKSAKRCRARVRKEAR